MKINPCEACAWGARALKRKQCGAPGISARCLAEYAALRGYDIVAEADGFWRLVANESGSRDTYSDDNNRMRLKSAMVYAAADLGDCPKFRRRSAGERDEWRRYAADMGEEGGEV